MQKRKKTDPKQFEIRPVAILPTPAGFAVFLNRGDKTGVIFVDPSIGIALPSLAGSFRNRRPLTHELVGDLLDGFGITVRNICITSADGGIYKARIVLEMTNEIEERKIVELDARSSDAIALSLKRRHPLHILATVWDGMEDVTKHYTILKEENSENEMIDLTELP